MCQGRSKEIIPRIVRATRQTELTQKIASQYKEHT